MSSAVAALGITLAVVTNTLVKAVIATVVGGRALGARAPGRARRRRLGLFVERLLG